MKKYVILALMVFFFGCALPPISVRLYGIEGPYKGRVLEGKAYRKGDNQGRIVLTMPDGEVCTGEYSIITESSYGELLSPWNILYESVYGLSYISMVQGKGEAMATAIGDKGTILEVTFFADTRTGHGFGVAKDSRGNIYRVHF